jgi:hypothetical protein
MTEPTPLSDWQGQWDDLGSYEARIGYLRRYFPGLLATLDAARATVPADLDTLEIAVLDASTREFPSVRKAMIRRAFADTLAARPVPAAEPPVAYDEDGDPIRPDPHNEDWYDGYAAAMRDVESVVPAAVSPSTGDDRPVCPFDCDACQDDQDDDGPGLLDARPVPAAEPDPDPWIVVTDDCEACGALVGAEHAANCADVEAVPAADDRAALMTIYGLVTDEPWTPTMRDSIEAIAGRALSRAGVSPSTGDAEWTTAEHETHLMSGYLHPLCPSCQRESRGGKDDIEEWRTYAEGQKASGKPVVINATTFIDTFLSPSTGDDRPLDVERLALALRAWRGDYGAPLAADLPDAADLAEAYRKAVPGPRTFDHFAATPAPKAEP